MKATGRATYAALAVLCLAFIMTPGANSGVWNHSTKVTFNTPVQLPGIVLPGGEYRFQLLDSLSNRHVVQVFNAEHSHVFGTFNTVPVYRNEPSSKTIFVMEERPLGEPEAIKEWYYPGELIGDEFIYSHKDKVMTTQVEPIATEPAAQVTPEVTSPEVATEVTPAEPAAPAATEAVPEAAAPEATQPEESQEPAAKPTEELPKTASNLPLFALLGSFLLLSGAALRRFVKA